MKPTYPLQTKSLSNGRSEMSSGNAHLYGFTKSTVDSEHGMPSAYEHASHPPLNRSAGGRQRREANAAQTFYHSLSWTLGFKEKYSLLLFIVFGGALFGFCLARAFMMNTKIMREQTPPGDFRWFDLKMDKIPYFWHIYTTIIGGLIVSAQFLPVIRRQYILVHRLNGYLSLLLLIPGNIAGAIVARRSFGGEINQQIAYYLLGIMITFALLMGFANVKKETRSHRRWMLSMVQPPPHYYQSLRLTGIYRRCCLFRCPNTSTSNGPDLPSSHNKDRQLLVWRCDEVFYVLQSTESLSQLFPQCVANGTDPLSNPLSVAVHASNHEGDLGKSSGARVVHGMCLWISMLISVVGVEIYIRKTETANYNRQGFVLEPKESELA
ncbi:hypothetical protein D9758_016809 [Tetrapyrgos nigripes]|uniref:Uncharacterized protein n=1 Tax=Tetrapyrgos nigripes TaxID=182062 RepID=A0A8H5FL89_9AGAR|nr:hypothetical protein D9758_016809 [Tetrapyrgos nigripes]